MEVEGWNKVSYCFKLIKDKDWQLCSQVAQLRQVKISKLLKIFKKAKEGIGYWTATYTGTQSLKL